MYLKHFSAKILHAAKLKTSRQSVAHQTVRLSINKHLGAKILHAAKLVQSFNSFSVFVFDFEVNRLNQSMDAVAGRSGSKPGGGRGWMQSICL